MTTTQTNLGALLSFALLAAVAACGSQSDEDESDNKNGNGQGGNAPAAGGSANPAPTGGSTPMGGLTGTGGETATGGDPGTGGEEPNGAAGEPVTPAACAPADMTGFFPTDYRPANPAQEVCTAEQVQQYFDACIHGEPPGDCDRLFQPGGEEEACGACLRPTLRNELSYGPLLRLEAQAFFAYETNTAGCVELSGDPECAELIQAREVCLRAACIDACPPTDAAAYTNLYQPCKQAAASGPCADYVEASNCISESGAAETCSGTDFESLTVAIGRVFCAGD